MKNFFVFLLVLYEIQAFSYDSASGIYNDINVIFSAHQLNASQCPDILKNVKEIFTSASGILFQELNGRFGTVNLRIPKSWTNSHCYTEGLIQEHQHFQGQNPNVIVGPYNQQSNLWTQQSQGCQHPGDFVYLPQTALNNSRIGKD